MNVISVSITMEIACRECEEGIVLQGDGDTVEEAEKDIHEQLEAENWTDGLCPDCTKKKFLK